MSPFLQSEPSSVGSERRVDEPPVNGKSAPGKTAEIQRGHVDTIPSKAGLASRGSALSPNSVHAEQNGLGKGDRGTNGASGGQNLSTGREIDGKQTGHAESYPRAQNTENSFESLSGAGLPKIRTQQRT